MNDEMLTSDSPHGDGGGKRFVRLPEKGVFGGVFAGLEAYFDINATLLRLLAILFSLFSNVVIFVPILAYAVTWMIIPRGESGGTNVAGNDEFSKVAKFGCLGCLGMFVLTCIVIALLLVVPLGYMNGLNQLFPNGLESVALYDDIDFNFKYTPNIPLLLFGVLLVFVLPVANLIYDSVKRSKGEPTSSRFSWIIVGLLFVAGIFVIINALTS